MEFSLRYPDVTFYLDLANPDHAQRVFQTCDVSIEIGELPDSTQIARSLACCRPICTRRASTWKTREPKHPSDLTRHECIEFRAEGAGRVTRWPLNNGDQHIEFTPGNRWSTASPWRRLAMLGAGIAVLVGGQREEQRSGQLLRVLPDWQLGPFPVYAVTETRLLPAKTRIFIEF